MQRRDFLVTTSIGFAAAALTAKSSLATTPDEIKREMDSYTEQALANFPLKLVETTGAQAFAKWQELKTSGQGVPVVLGGDNKGLPSFSNLLSQFGPNGPRIPPPRAVDDILRDAATINFPADLAKHKRAESAIADATFKADLARNPDMPLPTVIVSKDGKSRTYSRQETIAMMEAQPHEPALGDWPPADPSPGLTVAYDVLKGVPLPSVYIGIAPTDDWTTIPALLRWGGWNDCPAAEYHVAALRLWRDRYGAELIGMNVDTINLRVSHKPSSRDEALALARDQYVYCEDIIDQGVQTYSALASDLMANDWWYFWWD